MLTSFLNAITDFVTAHPNLAYATVFLMALSESIPIVGVVVPGTAVILAISALVPTGAVHLWPVMIAAVIGAVMSDGLSFWIGRRYHREALDLWPLNRRPDLIARSEAFFARHGDWSIFLARFTPGARAFVPLLAGVLRMPVRRFYIANVLSACVWAPAHVLPAVAVGASLAMLGETAKPLAILALLLGALIYAIVRIVQFVRARAPHVVGGGLDRLHDWASADGGWRGRGVLLFLGSSRTHAPARIGMALLLAAAAWLFFGVLDGPGADERFAMTDAGIAEALQNLRTATGDSVMVTISEFGDPLVVLSVTGAIVLWLAWRRAWRAAALWLAAVAGAAALSAGIGALDEGGEAALSALATPGGHAAMIVALYGFLALLVARAAPAGWRIAAALAVLVAPVAIAFARLYLGAYAFSDAAIGFALGAAWLATIGFFFVRERTHPVGGAGGLIAVVAVALALAGGINAYRSHAADLDRYALRRVTATMDAGHWWSEGWERLPSRRLLVTGALKEPLTLQWTGDLATLRADLDARGWRAPARWASPHALGWFAPHPPPTELPVTPQLAGGRLPALTMVARDPEDLDGSRLVLRLWPTDLHVVSGERSPVWIGSVVAERLDRSLMLVTRAKTLPDADAPRDALALQFPAGRLAARSGATENADWDGRVLLLREVPLSQASP